jgi:hypothetical protein
VGFVDYGHIPTSKPDQYASEALVFVLVGARSNWKCPIGYLLTDKMTVIKLLLLNTFSYVQLNSLTLVFLIT